jgi:hypothetical protein
MDSDSGRHNADESKADRARIEYLAGDFGSNRTGLGSALPADVAASELAELDDLRALLADPTLWAEPPAELEDAVVALIGAEAGRWSSTSGDDGTSSDDTRPIPVVAGPAAQPAGPAGPVFPGGLATGQVGPGTGPVGPATGAVSDLAAARERKERRTGARRFLRPAFLVAAAAVVVLTVSAVVLLRSTAPTQREFAASLSATELAPGATGTVTMLKTDSGWDIHLDATGLPRLDNGQFYQGWLRNAEGILVPIGTFNEGTDVTLWAGVPPDQFPTMTITRESADGDQASSGQRVLVGTAVEK